MGQREADPVEAWPALAGIPGPTYRPLWMTISTRRFLARPAGSSEPSGLALGAAGRVRPKPRVCSRPRSAPALAASQSATACARRSDSDWLYTSLPLEIG